MQQQQDGASVLPPITYPSSLPVAERREEIARAIAGHQVVVIAGETGSGKTTQLPKICLELGRGSAGLIGHTQPRRLAARTVAARIAEELGGSTGDLVGYQVRFGESVSAQTRVKLMTDGILLNEMQRDRLLRRYDTLIIDEAHERSLNIDFLLGYLKRILPRRPDLKLIVTSATIDVDSFARHFDDAPVIEVSGRTYPVQTHYLDEPAAQDELATTVARLVAEIESSAWGPRGDVLVFLPGEREIRELSRELRGAGALQVLPLYARLSQAEQQRVFAGDRSGPGLRVVLATNVAETSLTVPGIRYVIDPGDARISRYSHRTKLQRLPVEPISQASADQRRGRCGRVGPGVCLRLYSEDDYNARPEFTDPEIRRTNLASVILQMLLLGLGEVQKFPFLDPPDGRMVRDGYRLLEELGAVTDEGRLTGAGKRMARFPVDPRLARMVLAAAEQGCLEEVLVIASALSVQDPRERPADKRTQADQAHARFRHPRSDFCAWLNLWRYFEEQRQALSQSQLRKLCRREFLSYARMREWRDIHAQLCIACRQQSLRPARELPQEENYNGVHRALLSGLLGNIAQWQEGREYLGARNRRLQVFPGSGQARKSHKWLVAAEIVETTRVYAREVAAIDPGWALQVNPRLLKRHYYQPRWQARTGRVVAYERATLYGLTLADKRSVHYGPIAPQESRQLMIREGLVAGNYRQPPPFLRANLALVAELETLEARTRRRDIVAEEQVIYDFYDEHLPPDMYTARRLAAWLKKEPQADARLRLPRELLLARDPGDLEGQFPSTLEWQGTGYRLHYEFDPGHASDGVSVTVPVALLNRAPRYRFDWLVPGLLREKCIALVKGLPKEKRKRLVPVPDFVDRALAELTAGEHDLLQALATTLSRLGGVPLVREDWDVAALDDYYRMNIRVVDAQGKLLGQGRDLVRLVETYREDTRHSLGADGQASPAREGLTRWDFDELPQQWRFRQAGGEVQAWLALVDCGETVAIRLCDYAGQARLQHRLGVLRLLRLGAAQQVRYLRKQLLRGNDASLLLAAAALQRPVLVEDMIDAAFVHAACLDDELPRRRADFAALREGAAAQVVERATDIEATVLAALTALGEVRAILAAQEARKWTEARQDIAGQLDALLASGFVRDTPAQWFTQYPRYFKALLNRVQRLPGQYGKDQKYTGMLGALQEPLDQALAARPELVQLSPPAQAYRWMLEEFRVSLFAQNLGTRQAVSEKRLRAQWQEVDAWLLANPQ
ncbi:MAG: ATP-dependent RNA helicase HrpA [Halioglobus sp.]|nr:ATP-dependent RNA helicase HrpA [Halioglobus sp.]